MTEEGQLRLIEEIEKYEPFNEMEERDKELILRALRREENVFSRENSLCHMTASAWISSPDRTKVLMAYHNIYDSWSWLGGHADGDTDLLRVALKEAEEESGLSKVKPLMQDIFSLEVLTVDGHMKKGKYVSSHLHLNVTYLLEADDREMVRAKEDENRGVRWFSPEDAVAASSEPWFREHIYSKLNEKLYAYRALTGEPL
jgi:8-oxo-dGTP pyrophosphatase MutT (NUDIX family)